MSRRATSHFKERQSVLRFLRAVLECSIYHAPAEPGLIYNELLEVGGKIWQCVGGMLCLLEAFDTSSNQAAVSDDTYLRRKGTLTSVPVEAPLIEAVKADYVERYIPPHTATATEGSPSG
jgi:hypothetical protein